MTKTPLTDQLSVVKEIALDQLAASRSNPRRTMNEAELAELAASIREHGVNNPLLVRPDLDGFEIVCGHRRAEAATLAGLESVPCIVRVMDDATAAEIALIDNLQRVDVPAIEEAEAFNELLERLGSVAAVAAKVGKEQAYVAKRLKLCSLTCWSQDALRHKLITIDHALLLARLAAEEQNEALKWTLDRNAGSKTPVEKVLAARVERIGKENENKYFGRNWEAETILRLKEHIEEGTGIHLDRAPWPMEEDYLLPDAGSCLDCEKNTKANTPLFGDLAIGEPTCTDGQCFRDKTASFVEIKLRDAGQDLNARPKKRIARLSWKFSSVRPKTGFNDDPHNGSMNTCADVSKVIKAGAWVEAKKNSCPDVRQGVTVDWSEVDPWDSKSKLRKPGETLQVCIACGCKAHKKEYEKSKAPAANGNQNTKAAAAERERKAEMAKAENALRAGLVKAALSKVQKLAAPILRRLVLLALPDEWNRVDGSDEMFPGLDKALETCKPESVEFARAAASVLLVEERTDVWVSEWEPVDKGRKEFIALLKDLGYDASKAWDKPAAAAEAKPAKKAAAKTAAKKPASTKAVKKAAKKKAGRK